MEKKRNEKEKKKGGGKNDYLNPPFPPSRYFPLVGKGAALVRLDGKPLAAVRAPAPWRKGAGLFDEYAQVTLDGPVAGGRVEVDVAQPGAPPGLREYPPPVWPVPLVGRDAATRGNWVGRYGQAGHVLFGASQQLPAWVTAVTPFGGTVGAWPANASSPKWLSAPQVPGRPGARVACNMHTNFMEPMQVDVTLAPGAACYNLSLYAVDWDGNASSLEGRGLHRVRRQTVAAFVLQDVPGTGPLLTVGHGDVLLAEPALGLGEYLTFRVCSSVRLLVFVVLGDNAVLSGLFFDP